MAEQNIPIAGTTRNLLQELAGFNRITEEAALEEAIKTQRFRRIWEL